jgi:hypothetical protein
LESIEKSDTVARENLEKNFPEHEEHGLSEDEKEELQNCTTCKKKWQEEQRKKQKKACRQKIGEGAMKGAEAMPGGRWAAASEPPQAGRGR